MRKRGGAPRPSKRSKTPNGCTRSRRTPREKPSHFSDAGSFLTDLGEVAAARGALERARALAASMGSRYHEIRAQLQLTAVTASEGRLREAELLATQAVDAARDAGLDTVAAEGLLELGTTLQLLRNLDAAQTQLDRARSLAEERGARRLTTRATLQSASLLLSRGKPEDAVRLAGNELEFVRAQRYPRFELTALGIISRGHEDLSRFEEARTTAQRSLEIAERIRTTRRSPWRSRTSPASHRRWAFCRTRSAIVSVPKRFIAAKATPIPWPST